MSFSFKVKEEITQNKLNAKKSRAFLYGMLIFSKQFTPEKIVLQTENLLVAEYFSYLAGFATKNKEAVKASITTKKNNVNLYTLSVEKQADRDKIFEHFNIEKQPPVHIISDVFGEEFLGPFVAGAFLSCGSVNDPKKDYHLEFVVPTMHICNDFGQILLDFGILAKYTERKSAKIVYLKESENIEDILTLMGAVNSSMEVMQIKIVKNINNQANRAVNCDSANIEKTLKASEKQIADIEAIFEKKGREYLSQELLETALKRLDHPDWSLNEIAESFSPPLSRSGINHRFAKLAKMAQNLV